MVVNFIGPPCSSKTTTAALIFAQLKEKGIVCEFLVEEARHYIANKKWASKQSEVVLSDNDQVQIFKDQLQKLKIVKYSSPNSIVLLDSSPLNSLFYMSDAALSTFGDKWILETLSLVDLFFYSPSVGFTGNDPNRIHTAQQISLIEDKIDDVLRGYCDPIFPKLLPLSGSAKIRAQLGLGKILEKLYALTE